MAGGELELNSTDAAVRCVADVNISGGSINISSAADGIQAGKNINGFPSETGTATISGGSLFISSAKRAIDAKDSLSITGGTVFALSGAKKRWKPKRTASPMSRTSSAAAPETTCSSANSPRSLRSMISPRSSSPLRSLRAEPSTPSPAASAAKPSPRDEHFQQIKHGGNRLHICKYPTGAFASPVGLFIILYFPSRQALRRPHLLRPFCEAR